MPEYVSEIRSETSTCSTYQPRQDLSLPYPRLLPLRHPFFLLFSPIPLSPSTASMSQNAVSERELVREQNRRLEKARRKATKDQEDEQILAKPRGKRSILRRALCLLMWAIRGERKAKKDALIRKGESPGLLSTDSTHNAVLLDWLVDAPSTRGSKRTNETDERPGKPAKKKSKYLICNF